VPSDPYKFDRIKREMFLDHLREGGRRGASAKAVGVSRPTVCDYARKYPAFAAEMSKAEAEANELVENALFQAAINGNVTAALAWLYSRDPERWRDMRKLDYGVPVDGLIVGPIVMIRPAGGGATDGAIGQAKT
jgi:hypothetical protein